MIQINIIFASWSCKSLCICFLCLLEVFAILCSQLCTLVSNFGIWSVHYLGFIGSCRVVSWSFWHVGQTSSTDSDLRCFGEWSLIVLCGSFGGKVIHVPLTRMKDRFMSCSFSFFKLCWLGKCYSYFYFYFFIWYAWFLFFHCYLVFFPLLLLAHGLCDFFPLYFFFFFQWSY